MFAYTQKIIIPKKIADVRGTRSRADVVKSSGSEFTEQDLYNWEKGKNAPRPDRVPYLLKGLNCTSDDITEEKSFQIAE